MNCLSIGMPAVVRQRFARLERPFASNLDFMAEVEICGFLMHVSKVFIVLEIFLVGQALPGSCDTLVSCAGDIQQQKILASW